MGRGGMLQLAVRQEAPDFLQAAFGDDQQVTPRV
jgi:hypothetical protein